MYNYGVFTYTKAWYYHLDPGNRVFLGSVVVEWNPAQTNRVNLSFLAAVLSLRAEAHNGDVLRFELTRRYTVDDSACSSVCWSPFFDESASQALMFLATVAEA